ncbi:Uncharacterised protein r2_g2513 [Pycnogonum litorale]
MDEEDTDEISRSLNDNRQTLCPCRHSNATAHQIGLLYSVTSAICLGIGVFLIALSGKKYDPLQIIFEIYCTAAVCAGISMIFLCVPIKPYNGEGMYVFLHAVGMIVSETSNTYGVILLAPSVATVILDTNPIFTALLAFIFLHENIDVYDGISILITCIGAVTVAVPTIVSAPPSSLKSTALGVSSAFLSAVAVASYGCLNRKIERTHPLMITAVALASVSFVAGICCFGTGRFTWHHETRYVLIIIASGVLVALGHIILARAFQLSVASYVNTANSMDTPTVMILQTMFLNVHLTIFPILGSLAIMIGVTLLGLKELILAKLRVLSNQLPRIQRDD